MEQALKPCPFCGHSAIAATIPQRSRSKPRHAIVCGGAPSCRSSVAMFGPSGFLTAEEAAEAWNDRTPTAIEASPVVGEIEAVAAALIILARYNIPPDIQELLVTGDPMRSIPPGALHASLASLQSQVQSLTLKLEERDKALEPFADAVRNAEEAAAHYGVDHRSEVPDSQLYGPLGVRWGDLRRARALQSGGAEHA